MKFNIMDHTGHSVVEFTAAQRFDADQLFAKLLAEGHTAATRVAGSTDYQLVRDPTQLQDETVFVPQLKGG